MGSRSAAARSRLDEMVTAAARNAAASAPPLAPTAIATLKATALPVRTPGGADARS